MRKYILQQAVYLKQMKLYLRLTDATGTTVFKVFPIAPMVSFSQPEAQVDQLSNLHVLSQIGARSFRYCIINPEGNVVTQQTYDYAKTRPVLRATLDGKISVAGGVQRLSSTDLPSPSTAQLPKNDAQTQKP